MLPVAGPSNIDEIPVKVDQEKSMWYMSSMKLYGSSKLCSLWFSLALRNKLEEQGKKKKVHRSTNLFVNYLPY